MAQRRKALSRRDLQKIDIWEGAKGLVDRNEHSAIPPLIRTLKGSKDTEKRTAAAYALAWLDDRRSVRPLLLTLLNNKERPKVRGQAAEGLGYLCMFKSNVPVLRGLIISLSDRSTEVRFWSVFALGQIRNRSALSQLSTLAEHDNVTLRGWWTVAKEAKDAIKIIERETKSKARKSRKRRKIKQELSDSIQVARFGLTLDTT